jgi:RNA polymerase sigma-70 factor (ECF subfamily)
MLGNCPEADDVGQEVFIGFYKNLTSFRGDSSVSTYLTRIAINLSLNELKRRKRRGRLFVQTPEDQPPDAPDESISPTAFEDRELVNWALAQLPEEFKAVVVLRMVQEYSTAETAELLKIPLGTAQSRLARGLAKMREVLKPHVGGAL